MTIITKENRQTASRLETGAKADNLFTLDQLGLTIPPFIVVPNSMFIRNLPEYILEKPAVEIISYIHGLRLDDELTNSIINYFDDCKYFAVRSSSITEDGVDSSFAGQYETFLNVPITRLEAAIKDVWCSAFSKRVMRYRQRQSIESQHGMAVIVQEMIDADVAGVAFGIDPVSGDKNTKVISSVYGLGEGVVSGQADADTFMLNKTGMEERIVAKKKKLVRGIEGGTESINVSEELWNKPSLDKKQLKELVKLLDILYTHFNNPQDIEFALARGRLYLLQTRPITGLPKSITDRSQYIVWDNSNIIESYPGVTTPLTFSFIIKMYEAVYRQFVRLMGVSKKEAEENSEIFANMLGLIQGQVYYNLASWYRALALLPGYSINARFMENMMGVKERFDLPGHKGMSKQGAWWRLSLAIVKMIISLQKLPVERKKFVRFLEMNISEYEKIDFDICKPEQLIQYYKRFEHIMVKEWRAPLVNDFFAMIYFGLLQKLITKWNISSHANLHNDLHCGSNDIISTEPIVRLLDISSRVAEDDKTQQIFIEEAPDIVWEILQSGRCQNIKELIDAYIQRFGDRCVGELKLETVSYKQNPTVLIQLIQSYVKKSVSKQRSQNNIGLDIRKKAENTVGEVLKDKAAKRIVFNYILGMSRSLVSSRENLRYERTRAFGVVRSIFVAMGKQFFNMRIITHERDIFYLTKEEIFNYVKGTAVTVNIKELIACRKNEFEKYKKEGTHPERIVTRGVVYENNFSQKPTNSTLKRSLTGIGCCPGKVRGFIRIVLDSKETESLEGNILVTSSTDPGWVTLFPSAAAIIVERGSLLSHSAIVSRELGIPCIVGVAGLLSTLKNGDEIEMDGSTGEIKVLTHDEREITADGA